MKQLLLTGFEPFGDWTRNPSAEIASALDGWTPCDGWRVVGRRLPVDLTHLDGTLGALRREIRPTVIVHVGLAGHASEVAVERIGINVADFTLPDNAGRMATDQPLVVDGPAAYLSTLPARAIVDALRQAGIPARISNSAGTYLCNAALYLSLHAAAQPGSTVRGVGFIHLPPLREQAASRQGGLSSMCFELMLDALRHIVRLSSRGLDADDAD